MFRILLGMVLGAGLTLAALHPNDAKIAANSAVDKIHSTYNASSKALNEPSVPKVADATVDQLKELSPELQAMIAKELAQVKK